MEMLPILAKRRDAVPHTRDELNFLARGAADGSIPDYQLAAWLMAAVIHPLGPDETTYLTLAMAESGERMDLTGLPKPWVDKHSTGGVGDKTTLVLLPLLAACGLTMVKMSGRGLGITGGTIDKLESVPGFRTDLSPQEMVRQASQIGVALTGQSPNLAPADKALYALRDVTGTTASIPLLVSSILSKKVAGGAEIVVLDVKCGSGAFMTTLQGATELAEALADVGRRAGLKVRLAITDMDQPLGSAVGNALEVAEAWQVLRGDLAGPSVMRFRELCLALAQLTLEAAGVAEDPIRVLESGRAFEKAQAWYRAQGGSVAELPKAPVQEHLLAEADGWVASINARTIGETVIALGGGRRTKTDVIDPAVGIQIHLPVGERVSQRERMATIHAATQQEAEEAMLAVRAAIQISPDRVDPRRLVLGTL